MEENPQTEPCVLGGEILDIPKSDLLQERVFRTVFSDSTWKEVLTEEERDYLRKFLPPGSSSEQDTAVHRLFNLQNIKFGNPLKQFHKALKRNKYSPDNWYYSQLKRKALYKDYKNRTIQRNTDMLENLMLLREHYLNECSEISEAEIPEKLNLAWRQEVKAAIKAPKCPPSQKKARALYNKLLSDVGKECAEELSASADEDSDADEATAPVTNTHIADLLKSHIKRRLAREVAPSLDTRNTVLTDVMDRVYFNKPDSSASVQPTKKAKLSKTALAAQERLAEKAEKKRKLAAIALSSRTAESSVKPPPAPPIPPQKTSVEAPIIPNALHVLKSFMLEQYNALTAIQISEKLNNMGPSALTETAGTIQDWGPYINPILRYLAAQEMVMQTPSGGWIWPGGSQRDTDDQLNITWNHLVNAIPSLTLAMKPADDASDDYEGLSGDEGDDFKAQEQRRFSHPHKSFVYKLGGHRIVVPPVKGVYDKLSAQASTNKAREHALLINDRPSYVTLLTLVRDAAARLPNGEGTRYDICDLLKQSQYLSESASDNHINTVVSGALDRLHYEKDPCVKYDQARKVWAYLHGNRSAAQLERIHEAQGAAVKAKKALKPSKAMMAAQAAAVSASKEVKAEPTVKTEPLSQDQSQELASSTGSQSLLGSSDSLTTLLETKPPASLGAEFNPRKERNLLAAAVTSGAVPNLDLLRSASQPEPERSEPNQPMIRQLSFTSAHIAGLSSTGDAPTSKPKKLAFIPTSGSAQNMASLISSQRLGQSSDGQPTLVHSSQLKGPVFYQKVSPAQGCGISRQKMQTATTSSESGPLVHRIVNSPSGAPVLARLIQTNQSQSKGGSTNQQFTHLQLQGNRQIAVPLASGQTGRPIQILTTAQQNMAQAAAQRKEQTTPSSQAKPAPHSSGIPGSRSATPSRIVTLQQHLGASGGSKILTAASAASLLASSQHATVSEGKSGGPNMQLVKAMLSSSEGRSGSQAYVLTIAPHGQPGASPLQSGSTKSLNRPAGISTAARATVPATGSRALLTGSRATSTASILTGSRTSVSSLLADSRSRDQGTSRSILTSQIQTIRPEQVIRRITTVTGKSNMTSAGTSSERMPATGNAVTLINQAASLAASLKQSGHESVSHILPSESSDHVDIE